MFHTALYAKTVHCDNRNLSLALSDMFRVQAFVESAELSTGQADSSTMHLLQILLSLERFLASEVALMYRVELGWTNR